VRRHHHEPRLLEEVGVDDAVLHRTVAQCFQHRPHVGTSQGELLQLRRRRRAAERLERPHSAPHQLVDDSRDECARQFLGGLPGLDAHRRQQHRVGRHRPGGKPLGPRYRPRRGVQDVAEALLLSPGIVHGDLGVVSVSRVAVSVLDRDLAAATPLQHHHRQPRLFFEFGVGEMVLVTEDGGVDLPENAPACVLGKVLERLEPQRNDASGH